MFLLKGNSSIDPNSVFSSLSSDLRREPSGDRNRSVISDHCFCTDWWVCEILGSWCEDFFPSWFLSEEEYSERTFNTLEILIFFCTVLRDAWEKRLESATLDSPARADLSKGACAENRHLLQRGREIWRTRPTESSYKKYCLFVFILTKVSQYLFLEITLPPEDFFQSKRNFYNVEA